MSEVQNKKILVLNAGGTFGMVDNGYGLVNARGETLFNRLRKHPDFEELSLSYEKDLVFKSFRIPNDPEPIDANIELQGDLIDSSSAKPETWEQLANVVTEFTKEKNFAGIIIIHGTDTLAYSSSALSFMLRGIEIPVILTAAQISVFSPNSDGWGNLSGALTVVQYIQGCVNNHRIPGVYVFFNSTLFHGACVRKINASTFNAFGTRSEVPIVGQIRDGGFVFNVDPCKKHYKLNLAKQQRNKTEENKKYCSFRNCQGHDIPEYSLRIFNPNHLNITIDESNGFVLYKISYNVVLVKLYPGLTRGVFSKIIEAGKPLGVILECYGTGNHPEEFSEVFRSHQGTFFGLVTQCHEGLVASTYAVAAGNNDLPNVVNCLDMTSEAAFTKLCVLLGPYKPELFNDQNEQFPLIWKRIKNKLNYSHIGECRNEPHFNADAL